MFFNTKSAFLLTRISFHAINWVRDFFFATIPAIVILIILFFFYFFLCTKQNLMVLGNWNLQNFHEFMYAQISPSFSFSIFLFEISWFVLWGIISYLDIAIVLELKYKPVFKKFLDSIIKKNYIIYFRSFTFFFNNIKYDWFSFINTNSNLM